MRNFILPPSYWIDCTLLYRTTKSNRMRRIDCPRNSSSRSKKFAHGTNWNCNAHRFFGRNCHPIDECLQSLYRKRQTKNLVYLRRDPWISNFVNWYWSGNQPYVSSKQNRS